MKKAILLLLIINCILVYCIACGNHKTPEEQTSLATLAEPETAQTINLSEPSTQSGDINQYYGELSIPQLEYQVSVYWADVSGDGESAQTITDKENSAAVFQYGRHHVIADHDYQGFDIIKNIKPNDTCSIIKPNGSAQILRCVATAKGINAAEMYISTHSIEGEQIVYSNEMPPGSDEEFSENLINLFNVTQPYTVMYTCDNSPNIFITFWKEVQ